MKTKTLKLTAILLIFAGVFTACEEKIEPFLNIDKTSITAPAESGTFTVSISNNGGWTAVVQDAANNLWLTLNNTSGINDGVITINIAKNSYITARSATVKISMGDLSEIVVINQEKSEVIYPIDIPFMEIWRFDSRNHTRCIRINQTPTGHFSGRLILINNDKELENYISSMFSRRCFDWPSSGDINCLCGEDVCLPVIDFSRYSLLIAYGNSNGLPRIGTVYLQQFTSTYVLSIDRCGSLVLAMGWWQIAIVTDKITEKSDIELKLNLVSCELIP